MVTTPSAHRFVSKVLIADDEIDTVASLRALLEVEHFDVLGVHSGESVLREVPKFLPDAVLVDIGMPDMTGYVIARVLRALRGSSLLLIAITGRAVYSDEEAAWLAGFDHHVTKPYRPDAILALLRPLAARTSPQSALAAFLDLRRFEFNPAAIEHAPADQGVYGLFEDGELIYIGAATNSAENSIRSCLQSHRWAGPVECTARASHYCWVMSSQPGTRHAELLREYAAAKGRAPRCQHLVV